MNISNETIDKMFRLGYMVNPYDYERCEKIKNWNIATHIFITSVMDSEDSILWWDTFKVPIKKEITVDWLMAKIEKESTYKNLSKVFKNVLKGIRGSVYPTTYGVGVWNLLNVDETKQLLEQKLNELDIKYRTEYSDAKYILRFIISKEQTNLNKIKDLKID